MVGRGICVVHFRRVIDEGEVGEIGGSAKSKELSAFEDRDHRHLVTEEDVMDRRRITKHSKLGHGICVFFLIAGLSPRVELAVSKDDGRLVVRGPHDHRLKLVSSLDPEIFKDLDDLWFLRAVFEFSMAQSTVERYAPGHDAVDSCHAHH